MVPRRRFSLILFDLGKVILPFDIRIATKKFEKECSIPSEEIVRRIMGTPLDRAFEEGKLLPEEFYLEVKKRIELDIPFERFTDIWNDIFSENPKVSGLLRRLKNDYPVAIISNTNILHFNFVYQRFSIVREIGQFILSFQVGVRKPDSRIFQIALERFHATPTQTLYIDDREDFITAAGGLGLVGIHFRGGDPLERELQTLNILPL